MPQEAGMIAFDVLAACEMLVPAWAERVHGGAGRGGSVGAVYLAVTAVLPAAGSTALRPGGLGRVGAAMSSMGLVVVGLVVLDETLHPGRRRGSLHVHSFDAR